MDDEDFLLAQFTTLREEIKETKARIFKTLGFGIAIVPAAHYLGQAHDIDVIVIALPVLVLVVGLMYLSENNAVMRCGRYIGEKIEPRTDVVGWEEWLSTPDVFKKRTVDRYLFSSFYLLFLVYYAGSVFLTARLCLQNYGITFSIAIVAVYIVIGIWSAIFLLRNALMSTTTARDNTAAT
jgi:hypothetical protein